MYFDKCLTKKNTLKAFIKINDRNILIGETKSMLDWPGFNTICFRNRFIKVPIWLDYKITGHISLSYEISKSATFQEPKESNYLIVNSINLTSNKQQLPQNHHSPTINKSNSQSVNSLPSLEDLCDEKLSAKSNNYKVQTNVGISYANKVNTSEMGIQVEIDDFSDALSNKTIDCDVHNIFRCTHEITLCIEKKYDSFFNYVTYQFPESITDSIGNSKQLNTII